jgi:hypothetical protein
MVLIDFFAGRFSGPRVAAKLDIATSTWNRIKSTGKIPTPGILARMESAYKEVQKNRLTRAGFSTKLANKFKIKGADTVDDLISRMNQLTVKIAGKRDIDIYAVRRSMRLSENTFDYLEKRVTTDESP